MATHCAYPTKTNDVWGRHNIVPFGTKLEAGVSHIGIHKGQFETKREACDSAATALHQQHIQCQSDDVQLQSLWCAWAKTRTSKCEEQHECHTQAHHEYTMSYFGMLPKSNSRVEDARNIYFVICLVQRMASNETQDINGEQYDNFEEWVNG